jgi:hypothetical protein
MKTKRKNTNELFQCKLAMLLIVLLMVIIHLVYSAYSAEIQTKESTNKEYVLMGSIAKHKSCIWWDKSSPIQGSSKKIGDHFVRKVSVSNFFSITLYKVTNAIIWKVQDGVATNIYSGKKAALIDRPSFPTFKFGNKRYFFIVDKYTLPAKFIQEKNLEDYLIFRLLKKGEGRLFPEGTDMFNMELKRYNITPKDIQRIDQKGME